MSDNPSSSERPISAAGEEDRHELVVGGASAGGVEALSNRAGVRDEARSA